MQTQNICSLIRIVDTPSGGVVVPPDQFGETDNGSSLNLSIFLKSVFIIYLEYAKDLHLFLFF
jgi:hypothetical protein